MSLKIEQILDSFYFTKNNPRIFSTGAFLIPLELNNGKNKRYVWVVDEFQDENYFEGNQCLPRIYAKSISELIILNK